MWHDTAVDSVCNACCNVGVPAEEEQRLPLCDIYHCMKAIPGVPASQYGIPKLGNAIIL